MNKSIFKTIAIGIATAAAWEFLAKPALSKFLNNEKSQS